MLKHFTSLDVLSAEQFRDLLAVATYLKRRRAQGVSEHALSDKTLAELALSASWLVASGARSRAQVVEVAKKYGITFADETSVRAQAEALAS